MIVSQERPTYDIRRIFNVRVDEGFLIQIWILLFIILYFILTRIEG
jgi:hypothetical protein